MTLKKGKGGQATLLTDSGKYLHSRIHPEREAVTLFQSQIPDPNSICGGFILLNPGLPYISNYLTREYPKIPQCIITSDELVYELTSQFYDPLSTSRESWHPAGNVNLVNFLISWLSPKYLRGVGLIQGKVYNDTNEATLTAQRISEIVLKVFQRVHKETLTRGFFGPIRFKNIVRNILLANSSNMVHFNDCDAPRTAGLAVLVASGPSLEDIVPLLKRYRNNITIYALPSSIHCLAAHTVEPDIIITSDSGFWAGEHLRSVPLSWKSIYFAASIAWIRPLFDSAFMAKKPEVYLLPIQDKINQMLIDPRDFCKGYPETATVSAFAFDILSRHHQGRVLCLGLDLALRNLRGHASPHTFDTFLSIQSNRLQPMESLKTSRDLSQVPADSIYAPILAVEGLKIYREWFRQYFSKQTGNEIFRYAPGDESLGDVPNIERIEVDILLSESNRSITKNTQNEIRIFTSPNKELHSYLARLESDLKAACTDPLNPNSEFDDILQELSFFDYKKYWRCNSPKERETILESMRKSIHALFKGLVI